MIKKLWIAAVISLGCLTYSFSSMAGEPLVEQAQCENVGKIISTIRGMYNQTKNGSYTTKGNQQVLLKNGESTVVCAAVSTGNEMLEPLMKEYGYQTYLLEFYYDNPDYENAYVSGWDGPNFIYAVIDGKEYRYYFQGNSMLRRIGPEGTISDLPKTNDFLNQLYQAGCFYQSDLSRYDIARNLNEENLVFGNRHYDIQQSIVIQAGVLESMETGNYEAGVFVIDANTQLSGNLQKEKTWRRGDNGYTWLKRYLETEQINGGYAASIECFCVNTTGRHVDYIEGIYATH